MRYRRVTYRYALVFAPGGPRPLGESFSMPPVRLAQPCWRPPADVYETDSHLCVTVEVAGIDPEAVEIMLFDDALVIEGNRRIQPEEGPGLFHTAEIRQGPFRVEVELPQPADADQVDARYERGLLQITLRKEPGR